VEHKTTSTRYALKRVNKRHGKVPEEVQRECDLLMEQNHPFIMHLVKVFERDRSTYMLSELISGGELHAAIRTISTSLTRTQTQFYVGTLVLVLEELLDRNILYRDLKPENVMLDQQGYLKLIDFGIAKKLEEGQTKTFTMIGTPHYMAPETIHGKGYGSEVDIWSLGIMCFEFSCGYLPFADEIDDPLAVCTGVCEEELVFPPDHADYYGQDLIKGLLIREPSKRLEQALEVSRTSRTCNFSKSTTTTVRSSAKSWLGNFHHPFSRKMISIFCLRTI
jgi:cGMP-dependent protein kinase